MIKIKVSLFAIAILLMSCKFSPNQTEGTTIQPPELTNESRVVSTIDFAEKVKTIEGTVNEDYYLLDVRTPEEYAEGHLFDAKNINFYDDDFKDQMAALKKDKTVLVYCRSGGRSGKAVTILEELGFTTIYDLEDGFNGWKESKLDFDVDQ